MKTELLIQMDGLTASNDQVMMNEMPLQDGTVDPILQNIINISENGYCFVNDATNLGGFITFSNDIPNGTNFWIIKNVTQPITFLAQSGSVYCQNGNTYTDPIFLNVLKANGDYYMQNKLI
jgi:hypothetical protein